MATFVGNIRPIRWWETYEGSIVDGSEFEAQKEV